MLHDFGIPEWGVGTGIVEWGTRTLDHVQSAHGGLDRLPTSARRIRR